MSPAIRHKYKYFHSTVQRAKYRREKFHFCRLPFAVRPRNVKLNLSNVFGTAKLKRWEICTRYMNVSENMFPRFIETNRRKNSSRKATAKVESSLESR